MNFWRKPQWSTAQSGVVQSGVIQSGVIQSGVVPSGVVLIAAFALTAWFVCDRPALLISSDTLFPAEFVWDLLHHDNAWSGFEQPHIPSFFPDLAVFGPVQTLTGNWRAGFAAWVFVALTWLVLILRQIIGQIAGIDAEAATRPALAALLPIAAAAAPVKAIFPFLFVLLPYTHGGSLLLALSAAVITSPGCRWPPEARMLALVPLCFAAALSDQLFAGYFLVPATLALGGQVLTRAIGGPIALRLIAGAWSGAVLGLVCVEGLDRQIMLFPPLAELPLRYGRFFLALPQTPAMAVTLGVFALSISVEAWRRGWRGFIAGFWPVFALVSSLGSLSLTILLYEDIWSWRYALPLLWWSVTMGATLTARASFPMASPISGRAVAAGFALICLVMGPRVPRLFHWNAPLATCLRDAGLRTGLADFWVARATSAASDWQLQIQQIDSHGAARIWGNNRFWFTRDIHDGAQRPEYRFVVLDGLPETRIAAAYGAPDRVMMCGTVRVWIYNDPDQVYANLRRASPSMEPVFASGP